MSLYVHRDPKDYLERGAQDVHLDFHTVPVALTVFIRSVFLYVHRNRMDFQRQGAQEFELFCLLLMLLYVYRDHIKDNYTDFHTVPEL